MSAINTFHLIEKTTSRHTGTIIFFHGSGSTGDHMKEWVNIISRKAFNFPQLNVIFPTAPIQSYTLAGGEQRNVWFDRLDLTPDTPDVLESVNKMESEVNAMIKKENDAGIPTNRIVIGGFSMGGALALHAAYRWRRDVAAAFCFNSFLSNQSPVYESLQKASGERLPPLLQVHGLSDTLVDCAWGHETCKRLQQLGVNAEWLAIPNIDHSIERRGMSRLKEFVEEVLPNFE